MSTNLVSDITQVLSSNLVSRVASSLGLGKPQVESALQAGVPALLAAFSSLTSTPGGAAALSSAVTQQQPGVLSSLASAIGGSGQKPLIDSGANVLTSLLGGTTMSALADAVGQFAGIGSGGSRSLMGLLGPVILGVLGQHQRASGLDATGIANLIASQKDNILRAVPAGFSKTLGETGLLDSLAGPSELRRAQEASRGYDSPGRYAAPSPKASPQPGWLIPALALLAVGALAWYLLSRPSPTETARVEPPAKVESPAKAESPLTTGTLPEQPSTDFPALDSLRGVKVGDVDVGAQVAEAVSKLRASLAGITDETSAQSAAAPLKDSVDEFNKLSGMLGQLSPENRQAFAKAIAAAKPTLDRLFDKALQIPGVAALIKPSIDSLRSEIDTLATA